MNTTESRFDGLTYSASAVSEVSSSQHHQSIDDDRSHASSRFVDVIPDNPKIESKDHMWKPAPILGRDFTAREVSEPEVVSAKGPGGGGMPFQAASLRGDPLQNNFVLPTKLHSH